MTDKQLPKRSITKIRLENFQCYEDATLNLSSGINLITGSSDHGKTALIRALKFLMHNVWDDSFRRYGASETRVTAYFSDGAVCCRIKGEKRNCMMVRYADGKVETFDKWKGTKYPPEVVKALGNPPEDEAHGAISFAEQFEPLYMVMLTNTALPKSISELINIDDLDEAATMLSRKSKQEARKVKDLLERIARYDSELNNYEGLDEELEKLEELEAIESSIDATIAEIADAKDIMRRYRDVMSEGIETSNALKRAKAIVAYKDRYADINSTKASIDVAIQMAEEYDLVCSEIDENKAALDRVSQVASSVHKNRLSHINDMVTFVNESSEIYRNYKECCENIESISKEIEEFQRSLKENKKKADAMRKQLTADGLLCPTCNQPLGEDACLKS